MKTYLECVPCLFRQAIEAAREYSDDEQFQKSVVDAVAELVPKFGPDMTPPQIIGVVHKMIRERLAIRISMLRSKGAAMKRRCLYIPG